MGWVSLVNRDHMTGIRQRKEDKETDRLERFAQSEFRKGNKESSQK